MLSAASDKVLACLVVNEYEDKGREPYQRAVGHGPALEYQLEGRDIAGKGVRRADMSDGNQHWTRERERDRERNNKRGAHWQDEQKREHDESVECHAIPESVL